MAAEAMKAKGRVFYGRYSLVASGSAATPRSRLTAGPLGAAWPRGLTGSYQASFLVFLVCTLFGAFFMYLGRPPRPPEAALPADSAA